MRIAVDARTVFSPARRGTGRNLVDLYTTLAALEPSWEFVLFHQLDAGGQPFAGLPNVRPVLIDLPGDRWNLWQDVRLPIAAKSAVASVLHCPANTAPLFTLTPVVVTIHDLIPLETARDSPRTQKWFRRVRRSAAKARRIVTPSEYSRQAIARETGVPAQKITVNYWAPDRSCLGPRSTVPGASDRVLESHGLPPKRRYILAFGAADPRKNTAAIIDAWSRLGRPAREGCVLLIVGLQPGALERVRAEATARIPDGSCVVRGFAPDADLPVLMSGAAALCYPSKSEGFGLPILDAFACGTPVIASTTTSLPEVAGDAALLVDPDEPAEIARAMETLLVDRDAAARLRTAGTERVQGFSWERCARTLAQVFRTAAVGSGTGGS
jgi:glycosyltransferase involved in cell wall biosynthesis